MERLSAILSDPETNSRMRLKSAMSNVSSYGKITQSKDLNHTLALLDEDGADLLAVFLSLDHGQDVINRFLEHAKQSKGGQDSAYILLLKSTQQDTATVAGNLMEGIDGFLLEPYSVDQLVEITKLAMVVKKRRIAVRHMQAIQMVMNKASSEIDKIAELKSLGQGPGEHIRELKKLGGAIANLENQSLPDYFTFLFEIFEKAECPKHVAGGNDLSAARKRLNEKLNKMGARLLEDEEQLPEVAVAATASKESQPQRYLRKIS